MTTLFLVFSHKLTREQLEEANERFKVDKFIYLPEDLQSKWSNVPAQNDLPETYLDNIKEFLLLNMSEKNYVLVMGEYGLTYLMVNWCFENGFIPLYTTTNREYEAEVNQDGSIINKHIFKHIAFRLYKK